jgi:sodium-coupled neutral amino acid transporter 11
MRHFVITTVLILVTLVISLSVCDLGILLELTGSFSATVLAFVLPPMCYLKLAKGSLWEWNKVPHWICVTFGIVIMVLSTTFSITKIIFPSDTSAPQTCN